jgi:hypothetical protein
MKLTEKSSNNTTSINQLINDELFNSKFVKSGLFIGAGVLGILAIGYIAKVLNFTATHIKGLSNTIKTN